MSGPAVVIGSGPNGLAAAITLAEAGRDVTVLEAADHAGGAVATEELTLPGFRHDTFSAVYPAAAASPVFARWPLAEHGLRWVHPDLCYAHPLPDGTAIALARDPGETAASLDAAGAGDGAAWTAFAEPYLDHFGAWRDTLLGGFPPVTGATKLATSLGPAGTLEWARLLLMPADALAGQLFSAGGSRAWLYGAAMHGDVPPHGAGSAIAAAHLNVMGHAVGWPSPEGGAGRLAGALAGHLRALGGVIRTRAPVTAIRAERGRVAGVTVAGSEPVRAELVIADVTPHALLDLAGDALDGRYAARLRRYRYGPSTLKVDWALDGPIPWTAPEARRAGTVHVGGGEDETLASLVPVAARPPRPPLHAARPADHRRPDARAGRQAHRMGLHPRAARRRLGGAARCARRADGGADRDVRARLPRPDPRPPRPLARRPRGARREPRARRRRSGLVHARPDGLPPRDEPDAVPDAAARPVPRQRRDVPRRLGPGRPGHSAARAALAEHRLRRFTSLPWRSS